MGIQINRYCILSYFDVFCTSDVTWHAPESMTSNLIRSDNGRASTYEILITMKGGIQMNAGYSLSCSDRNVGTRLNFIVLYCILCDNGDLKSDKISQEP